MLDPLPSLYFIALNRARMHSAAELAAAWRRQTTARTVATSAGLPADAAFVWVLHYADITAPDAAEKIRATANCCCAVVGVDEKFPFLERLRARARAACGGEVNMIEMPLSWQNDDDWQHQIEAFFAGEHVDTADSGEEAPASNQGVVNAAVKPPRSRIDFAAAAAALGLPLTETCSAMYRKLPAAPPLQWPFSLLGVADIKRIRQQVLNFLQMTSDDECRDFGHCCLFVLVAFCRREAAEATALYDDILSAVSDDSRFYPLKRIVAVLRAEAMLADDKSAADKIKSLLEEGEREAESDPLFYAIVLRAALNAPLDNATKQMLLDALHTLMKRIPEKHHAVVGGGAFNAVSAVRKKIGDLL